MADRVLEGRDEGIKVWWYGMVSTAVLGRESILGI